jgi:hypothetical protein
MRDARRPQQMDRHPQRGAVLPIVAIALPVLLAMGAIVIDLGRLYQVRSQLQGTADAAALAGAALLPNETSVRSEAARYAQLNYPGYGTVVSTNDVVLGSWINNAFTAGGSPSNAVRVTARRAQANGNQVPLFLGGFVGRQYSDVGASAVAVRNAQDGGACIYVLHPSAVGSFFVGSGTEVNTCDVRVRSNSGTACPSSDANVALRVESNSRLYAQTYTVGMRGGCFRTSDSQWNPTPVRAGDFTDPLAALPPVAAPNECVQGTSGSGYTVPANGTYPDVARADGIYVWCGGLRVDGGRIATLRPGIHVMRGGGLLISSAKVRAQDVMFYNTCSNTSASCTVNQNGAQRIEVVGTRVPGDTALIQTAPSTGTYSGLLFFQDRAMSNTHENTFGSGTRVDLDGVLYFPTQHLIIGSGTNVTQGTRITFIANRITIASGTTMTFNRLPTRAPGALQTGQSVALVQ